MTYYKIQQISDWQRQVLYGTILGGSSVVRPKSGRNCYLSMRGNNAKWIGSKAAELGLPVPPNPYFVTSSGYYRWHSSCSPFLNEVYNLFYDNGQRKVDINVLDYLRDIGLMVWFLDTGEIRNDRVLMNTSFLKEGAEVVSRYFNEVNLDNVLRPGQVELSEKATKKLFDVIGHLIPSFMYSSIKTNKY